MFGHKMLWRGLLMVVLISAIALPLNALPVRAQINPPVSSAGGAGFISQPASTSVNGVLQAFNILGASHTATFTCTDSATGNTAAPPACYSVTGSAVNNTYGTLTSLTGATCAGGSVAPTSSTATCSLLPIGSTATITINPGSPDTFSLAFTGWVPATIACPASGTYNATNVTCSVAPLGPGTCPAATPAYTYSNGACVITAGGLAGTAAASCPLGAGSSATQSTAGSSVLVTLNGLSLPGCDFAAAAQKSYVEITALTNTGVCYLGFYSGTLGVFLGPECSVTFNATGTIDIQPVSSCSAALAALVGTPATSVYGPGTAYVCTNNVLGVSGVSIGQYAPNGVPLSLTVTGLGLPTGLTLESGGVTYCQGGNAPVVARTGVPITLCPTSGTFASLKACLNSTTNLQPSLCTEIDPPGASSATSSPPGKTGGNSPGPAPAPAPLTVSVAFTAGWQQVGGPATTNFGAAGALYSYNPAAGTYTDVSGARAGVSSAPPSCTGYWAYFNSPATVTVAVAGHSGDTSTCALAPGWNMVGNPFGSAAALPSGTTAYRWTGAAYAVVTSIPAGDAVWIANTGTATQSITLTAQ